MKTLAIYSNKGGVGKTATTVNLSYIAAASGLNTLICDLDPQSSTSYYFRIKAKLKKGAKGLEKAGKAVEKSIKGTDFQKLDLLPGDFSHRNLDIVFNQFKKPEMRLEKIISEFQGEYDLVILDSPPTINVLAENIFQASDIILVPLIPTPLSEMAHRQLLKFFKKKGYDTKKIYNFISMEDRRKKIHREFSVSLKKEFENFLENSIPYSSDIEKMGIERCPLISYASGSKAASAYMDLWSEIERVLFR